MTGSKEKRANAATMEYTLGTLYRDVAEGCIECGLCQKDCLFLKKYGTPKEIATLGRHSKGLLRESYECSLCGLCTAVCPEDIDPAGMFSVMRNQAYAEGKGIFKEHSALLSYERWGMSPLFTFYGLPEGCDTVFFPGCALAGSRAQRVMQTYEHLRGRIPDLGMVLDCCAKPSHDLGRTDFFSRSFGEMRKLLQDSGVQNVLVACPSCYMVWQEYGEGMGVRTIYEEFAEGELPDLSEYKKTIAVHDPCAVRDQTGIHKAVRELVVRMGFDIREMKHHGRKTVCCGEGGAACYIVPDYAENWTEVRAREAEDSQIITYCAGCTNFLGKRTRVDHVTDLLFEPDRTLAGKIRVTRTPTTWLRRFLLKRKLAQHMKPSLKGRRDREVHISIQERTSVRNGKELSESEKMEQINLLYEKLSKSFSGIEEISAEEALDLFRAGEAVFVDVRDDDERKVSILPNAASETQFIADPEKYRNKTVIVYCTIGYRSGKFVFKNQIEAGKMKNLRGGILSWVHAGGELYDNAGNTLRIHVYGPKWALQPRNYTAVFKKDQK